MARILRTPRVMRSLFTAIAACATLLNTVSAYAAENAKDPATAYPSRPLRVVVPFTAGSAADVLPRFVGQKLTEAWGQPLIVENRPSAGGIAAAQSVASATPDGHTLYSVSAGHAVSAALYKNLPYNTQRDFAGITLFALVPSILAVSPSSGIKSVKELIALARQKPGAFNYSTPGIGSANHLGSELLKSLAKIDVQHVPFKGIPEAMTAAMTGTVLFNLSPVVNVLPLAKSGKLVALATSTSKRTAAMPDLPTIAEAGVPGYAFDPWFGLLTTAATPRPVLQKINREVVRILLLPEIKEKFVSLGAEPAPMAPEAMDAHVRAEIAKFTKIVNDANIKVE